MAEDIKAKAKAKAPKLADPIAATIDPASQEMIKRAQDLGHRAPLYAPSTSAVRTGRCSRSESPAAYAMTTGARPSVPLTGGAVSSSTLAMNAFISAM